MEGLAVDLGDGAVGADAGVTLTILVLEVPALGRGVLLGLGHGGGGCCCCCCCCSIYEGNESTCIFLWRAIASDFHKGFSFVFLSVLRPKGESLKFRGQCERLQSTGNMYRYL